MSGAAHLNYTEEKIKLNYHHRPIKFLLAIFFLICIFSSEKNGKILSTACALPIQ